MGGEHHERGHLPLNEGLGTHAPSYVSVRCGAVAARGGREGANGAPCSDMPAPATYKSHV
jgi:hypothetical protein